MPAQLNGDVFTLCSPETHMFPLVSHSTQNYLQVSVDYLPRLEQIPSILLPHASFPAPAAARDASGEFALAEESGASPSTYSQDSVGYEVATPRASSTGSGQSTKAENSPNMTMSHRKSPRKDIQQAIQALPRAWLEGFPFSPPLSSPLSPKFLSGLSDHETCRASSCTTDEHTGSVSRSVTLPKSSLVPGTEHAVSSSNQFNSPPGSASFRSIGDNVNSAAVHTSSFQSLSVGIQHKVSPSYRTVTAGSSPCTTSMWMNGVRPPGASSPVSLHVFVAIAMPNLHGYKECCSVCSMQLLYMY